jgi:hypothetical protein
MRHYSGFHRRGLTLVSTFSLANEINFILLKLNLHSIEILFPFRNVTFVYIILKNPVFDSQRTLRLSQNSGI